MKGTVVTRNSLQISAITYARSKGIGVIRLLPDSQRIEHQLDHIEEEREFEVKQLTSKGAPRSSSICSDFKPREVLLALKDEEYRSYSGFFGIADNRLYGDLFSLLNEQFEAYVQGNI